MSPLLICHSTADQAQLRRSLRPKLVHVHWRRREGDTFRDDHSRTSCVTTNHSPPSPSLPPPSLPGCHLAWSSTFNARQPPSDRRMQLPGPTPVAVHTHPACAGVKETPLASDDVLFVTSNVRLQRMHDLAVSMPAGNYLPSRARRLSAIQACFMRSVLAPQTIDSERNCGVQTLS